MNAFRAFVIINFASSTTQSWCFRHPRIGTL